MKNNPTLSLQYLARPPAASGGQPPMLILLHGVGSNEADLFSLAPHLDERFLILSARAPLARQPGSYAWYPVQFTPTGFLIDPDAALRSQQILSRFIGEAVEAFAADAQRVVLMGFSQGAIMSLNTMLTQPETLSGVVAMSGRLLTALQSTWAEPERLRGFPVVVAHGQYDEVIPIEEGRAIRDYLSTLPVNLTYHEYPMGHTISEASLAQVQAWLTEQLDAPK